MSPRLIAHAVGPYGAFVLLLALLTMPAMADSERPESRFETIRYMALGDSVAAGRGATPQTQGYVYLLYRSDAIAPLREVYLSNAAVGDATTTNVLLHQLPQAMAAPDRAGFRPDVITITVGGNDLLGLLGDPNPTDPGTVQQVLGLVGQNLAATFWAMCADPDLRKARVFISNQYAIPTIDALIPGASFVVGLLNDVILGVATPFAVPVVDVHGAFEGRTGLLLSERPGADPFEVHPTNAGHRVIARKFRKAIEAGGGQLACPPVP